MKKTSKSQQKEKILHELGSIFKTLSDMIRIKIILALSKQSLNVNSLVNITGASQSNVSHQLRLLKDQKLVITERKGKNIYYSITCHHLVNIVDNFLAHIGHGGEN